MKAYLLVFDLLFAKGLKELEELPDWMTLNRSLPADENPDLSNDPLLKWNVLVDKEIRAAHNAVRKRTLEGEKNKWLDVLDKLYGEDSNPAFLAGFNYYDETPEQMIGRRTDFLNGGVIALKVLTYMIFQQRDGVESKNISIHCWALPEFRGIRLPICMQAIM